MPSRDACGEFIAVARLGETVNYSHMRGLITCFGSSTVSTGMSSAPGGPLLSAVAVGAKGIPSRGFLVSNGN